MSVVHLPPPAARTAAERECLIKREPCEGCIMTAEAVARCVLLLAVHLGTVVLAVVGMQSLTGCGSAELNLAKPCAGRWGCWRTARLCGRHYGRRCGA